MLIFLGVLSVKVRTGIRSEGAKLVCEKCRKLRCLADKLDIKFNISFCDSCELQASGEVEEKFKAET